jgi:pilus assembly protein Flp/PilA
VTAQVEETLVGQETEMFRSDAADLVRRFLADASGATAIEYALVASGIGVAVAGTIWKLGDEVKTTLYEKLVALF